MSLVLNTDFVGEWKISQKCADELDAYILRYEKIYLVQLLGKELYDLFIADLDAGTPQQPTTQRFIDIYNSFEQDESNCIVVSEGMRLMLIQLIYFHFVRDQAYFNSPVGTVHAKVSASSDPGYNGYNLTSSYNRGIENYRSIQWKILDESATYPEENTQHQRMIWGS
jgi:hypothetical protein